ncbi:DUF1214 domain-containing protein [Lysobacter sp. S4-A87]|uniref:DUF1254 domain-containing protein n=1 Tax=Lysobacter sp. S4-A87 TaxID=2925843 RepID=UPI001F52EE1A|nr:DUF1214 domain-containing protein [Lysobacter sp. S4-A87]UNK48694.1 DUF1214 domain-containing protein [Lysobacter sp. S4-A87]
MKLFSIAAMIAALALASCARQQEPTPAGSDSAKPPPAESAAVSPNEAFEIARDAYIFAFPLNYYYRTVHSEILDPGNPKSIGGFGKWRHDGLAKPADTETTMPNNDTPYSWAWVDLRAEPWVLTQPPADGNRFYSSVWGDLWGFIIDYPGSVIDGQKGGRYLLAPSNWQGELPKGVNRVIRGETTIVGTLTRTAVSGPADLGKMEAIQRGYKLEPLSAYLGQPAPAAAATPAWPAWDEAAMTDPRFFELTNFLLQFVVPNEGDKSIYERMARLGIGPGGTYKADALAPEIRDAVARGIADAHQQIVDGAAKAVDSTLLYGTRDYMTTRYLDRAVGVEAGGIIPNVVKQAKYGQWTKDASGQPMTGANKYTFTLPASDLPPVRFFWSLTMYDLKTRLLVDNPINRYSIGDRTPNLKKNPDGSLTIYVQHESPGKARESNWLPAPAGEMSIILRMYGPEDRILNGQYKLPDPVTVQ